MRKTRLTILVVARWQGKICTSSIPKKMNIKLNKKSEALLKEILEKNSRYGSVDIILNEALGSMLQIERGDFVES